MGGSRVSVVTGGSRGIGRAVVQRFAVDGLTVVFTYRTDHDAAAEVVEAARRLAGTVRCVHADVADLAATRKAFEGVVREWGGIDVLVNNAGGGEQARFAEATEAHCDEIMNVNAKGTFFAMQQAAHHLRDQGRIVNISSVNTTLASPGNAVYSASKAAIEQFTIIAALELGSRGITVNTVSPGATDTELRRSKNPPEALTTLRLFQPRW